MVSEEYINSDQEYCIIVTLLTFLFYFKSWSPILFYFIFIIVITLLKKQSLSFGMAGFFHVIKIFFIFIYMYLYIDMFEDMNEINDLMGRSYASPDGIDEVKERRRNW